MGEKAVIESIKLNPLFQEIWMESGMAQLKYGQNTLGVSRKIVGAFGPRNVEEIKIIIDWARANGHQLTAFSTGKNWGYGSATPDRDNTFIVDLSAMNQILDHNEELGLVTIQPGVTQQDLYEFLNRKKSELMVPTTGAGPQVSVLGNALDKGVGITPIEDHFSAIMALEAIIADGSTYRSTTYDFGGVKSDSIFKWKTGPVLEGLFAQSNLGIVTQATIALARRPERIEQFFAFVPNEYLGEAADCIRNIRQKLGSISGGINLMDQRRVLALMDEDNLWPRDRALNAAELDSMRHAKALESWVIVGALYGTKDIVRVAKKLVKKELQKISKDIKFVNKDKLKLALALLKPFPMHKFKKKLQAASRGLEILEGKPSIFALKLAYLKNRKTFESVNQPNPDFDQCGLIWFAPLLPIESKIVIQFNKRVTEICLKYNFDPIITFISISERCFDCTMPILFDRNNPNEVNRAYLCRDELFKMAQELQVFPHRMDIDISRKLFTQSTDTSVQMYKKIKIALDPQGIFAPGHYSKD